MTEGEAVMRLAALVAEIAARCWNDLGTQRSEEIQNECGYIVNSLDPEALRPADVGETGSE